MAERRVEYMPLSVIEAAPRNPKKHAAAAINRSINRFGLGELPLIDERTGRLVAGHGRLDQVAQMRRDGQAPPDGVRTDLAGDWLVPVLRGWSSRSDAEAEAYLLASNQLTIRGGWDREELAEILGELSEADVELFGDTGFTGDDLNSLLASTTAPTGDDWDAALSGLPDGEKTHAARTFNLLVEQAEIVDRAVGEAAGSLTGDEGNRNAAALTVVCEAYIRGRIG